jgi:hypothetical protein
VWTEDVLSSLFAVLFDIRRELFWIHELLEDRDGPEEEDQAVDDG